MFITQAKEIIEAVPSAKLDAKAAEKLVPIIEQVEDQMLEPLLGFELMEFLHGQYLSMLEVYGGITTDKIPSAAPALQEGVDGMTVAVQKKTIRLLRTIQVALVMRMLANEIYSLSTSLNIGGGANRASAGDYDVADDKHMQELRKEYFMNSKRACDQILILLERDAKEQVIDPRNLERRVSSSLWLEMWKDSESFYLKEDLLFPTLKSLTKYFPCNEPTKFIGLCPAIRYCQDTYITPRVDAELFSAIVDPSHVCNDRELEVKKRLCVALAYYIRAKEGARDERNEALMTADAAMSTALDYIEKTAPAAPTPPKKQVCECGCGHEDNHPRNEYSMFTTLIPEGVNRW